MAQQQDEKAEDALTAAILEFAGELGALAADLWYEGKLNLDEQDDRDDDDE